jgi:hypothetical protein
MYTIEVYNPSEQAIKYGWEEIHRIQSILYPDWQVTIRKAGKMPKRFSLPFGFPTKKEANRVGNLFISHPEIELFFQP